MNFVVKSFLGLLCVSFTLNAVSPKGLCYSPFGPGQKPKGSSPTYSQVVSGLVKAKTIVPRVRDFGIDTNCYLQYIPMVCESLGISYVISVWTSFQYPTTWAQGCTDLVNFLKKADTLKYKGLESVVYGYDNSFDYPSTPEASTVASLKTYLNTCKAAIRPYNRKLSHEENWDFVCRHPDLYDSLDFVAIRIMPQDDYVSARDAVAYVQACYDSVKLRFPNKEVKVTSVGWSTVNSSEAEQKLFLDSLTAKAVFDYFLFEFADEDWKSGAQTGYGLFTSSLQPKLSVDSGNSAFDFSNLFSADTTKLEGIVYNQSCFAYPVGMSLPTLQKQVGAWADTLAQIAQYTFFTAGDLSAAQNGLQGIFSANGNRVGLLSVSNPGPSVKIVTTSFTPPYGYGVADSLARQGFLDNIRHSVSALRESVGGDSVFIAAALSFGSVVADSVLKYPELVGSYDGVLLESNLGSFYNKPKIESYIDSMFGRYQERLPGKKLMVQLYISGLYPTPATSTTYLPVYLAFKKAKAKYGFALIYDNISYFYTNTMTKSSDVYKYLMPWRFQSATSLTGLRHNKGGSLVGFSGQRIVVGDVKAGAFLSVFSLSGRLVERLELGRNSSLDLKSLGLSGGTFVFELKAGSQSLSSKILIER